MTSPFSTTTSFWDKLGAGMTTENGTDIPADGDTAAPEKVSFGRKLIQTTWVISGMTLLSRILGLVRDAVFARYFSTSLIMDAFLVANRIPNMLRRFFAEGAFSQGFVPVMARYREQHSHDEAREFVGAVTASTNRVTRCSFQHVSQWSRKSPDHWAMSPLRICLHRLQERTTSP